MVEMPCLVGCVVVGGLERLSYIGRVLMVKPERWTVLAEKELGGSQGADCARTRPSAGGRPHTIGALGRIT